MSLLNKANQAAEATKTEAAEAHTVTSEASPAMSDVAAKALAAHQAGTALSTSRRSNHRVIENMKDALRVDFNTLAQIQANQGAFRDREAEKSLGDVIEIELLSWQENYVVSPNDLKAPKDLVKYSDDGKIAKDGTDMIEHLNALKADGYHKAKLQERCILVGALLATAKPSDLVGQLVQIDCAPQSYAMFKRYKANALWQMQSGNMDDSKVLRLRLTATPAKGPDNTDFTRIDFAIKG